MRKQVWSRVLMSALTVLSLVALPATALAHNGEDHATDDATHSSTSDRASETSDDRLQHSVETTNTKENNTAARPAKRLETAKLKVCQHREAVIAGIMSRSTKRAQSNMQLFSGITQRVKAFYHTKGTILDTYDQLAAAVDTAKAQTQASITALQTADAFSCASDDPKGEAASFKAALQQVRTNLEAYRAAVKSLITGVQSVNGGGN